MNPRWPACSPAMGCALLLLILTWTDSRAHRLGESYVYLNATESALIGRVEITYPDIDRVIPLDADGNGEIERAEVEARGADVIGHLEERLGITHEGREHPVVFGDVTSLDAGVAVFAQFHFQVPTLTPVPERIQVRYAYLFDGVEPTHRGLLVIESNTRTGVKNNESQVALIFGPENSLQTLRLDSLLWYEAILQFTKHGVWHIWIGLDHVLFVITLLLPSVLVLREAQWVPATSFKSALWYVLKVVSIFTVAHSLSLGLAAVGLVRLPAPMVEAVIAVSIAIAALTNIFPRFLKRIWLMILVFGFFHGFGFANVLSPIGLPPARIRTSLLGFNLGVEIGQIAIVCLVFPLLYYLRGWRHYRAVVVVGGSVCLILISLYWLVDRLSGG